MIHLPKDKRTDEYAFTLIEMLVAIIIIAVLSGLGIVGYIKYKKTAVEETVIHDLKNVSTFVEEYKVLHDGELSLEIPESFRNWSPGNTLVMNDIGTCVTGTNDIYDDILWRYNVITRVIEKGPCPDFVPGTPSGADPGDESTTPPITVPGHTSGDPEDPDPEPTVEVPVEVPGSGQAETITVNPVLFVGTSNKFTNNWRLSEPGADLMVNGDFECNSESIFSSSVVITGNAYFTNNCKILGNVWVRGTVKIDSNPHFAGSLNAQGDITFQSTARIDGDVVTEGTFKTIDGTDIKALQAKGTIGGEVWQNTAVKKFIEPAFPNYGKEPGASYLSWPDFLKGQAKQQPSTPNWSQVYTGQGCEISPNASWSLPGNIEIKENTTIDTTVACPGGINIGNGGAIDLRGDLVILATNFNTSNGIKVRSVDGQNHKFRVIVPAINSGTPRCDGNGTIRIGNGSTFDDKVHTFLYSESRVEVNGGTSMTGKIYAGCVAASGTVTLKYAEDF